LKEIVLDRTIKSKDLNKWLVDGIESKKREIAYLEGQIMALEEVRKGQCLDMDAEHQK
jgi:hypothetical protein